MTDELTVFTSTGPASHDLAFEGEMLERAGAGQCSVLAASWPGPVVVLGYAQPSADVDIDWCAAQHVPVLRRLSGGTGVIHRGDLSLSLALPREHSWAVSVVGLYDRFLDVLQPVLGAAGSDVDRIAEPRHASRVRSPICFEDQLADTLLVGGRKAVGCSQTRRRGGVLIHAAVLLGLDPGLYARVFRVEAARVERLLTPAIDAGWRPLAAAAVAGLAGALSLEVRWRDRPMPAASAMKLYRDARWAPVADGGMSTSSAEFSSAGGRYDPHEPGGAK